MAARPPGLLPFLDAAALAAKCRAAGISADRVPALTAIAGEIGRDRDLSALAWYMHWRVMVVAEYKGGWDIPTLQARLGDRSGLFYLLLALELPGHLAAAYRSLKFPPEVIAETAKTIACDEAMHLAGRGVPGISPRDYRGYCAYWSPVDPQVRLGRFEYHLRAEWGEYYYVYRRARDGAVIALIGGGLQVSEAGLLLDEEAPPSTGWSTTWSESEAAVTAFPIHPDGRILGTTVRLPKPEWRQVPAMTGPGAFDSEARLEMHVPFGGGMDWETVMTSLRMADSFFRRHLPGKPVRMFRMNTWFLDPRLPDILGVSSNPAIFQRAVYLVPDTPDSSLLGEFVFQRDVTETPVHDLPARTSVQRAVISFLKGGGVWQGGGMFILPEDLPNLREGFYRERFATLAREFGQ